MPLFTFFCPLSHFFLNKEAQEITSTLQEWWGGCWVTQNCWAWTNSFTSVFLNVSGSAVWIKLPGQSEGPGGISNTDFSFLSMKSGGWWNASPRFRELKSTQIKPASGYNGQQNWTAAMFYMRKFCCLGSRRGENDELCSECHGTANTVGKHEVICHLMCQGKCLFDAPRISLEEAGWNWLIYYSSSLEASLWLSKTFPGQERQNISYQGRNFLLNKPLGRDHMGF